MARFSGIPSVPVEGVPEWQSRILTALTENVELMTGSRSEPDASSRVVTRGQITVRVPSPQPASVNARGAGFTISGATVPSLADYQLLIRDVERVAQKNAELERIVAELITQLRR